MLGRERCAAGALRWLWYAPAAAYMTVIWTFSAESRPPDLLPIFHSDKILHGGEYGILALLLYLGVRVGSRKAARLGQTASILGSMVYGAMDELHQGFVPGRQRDIFDLMADVAGAVCAMALVTAVGSVRARRGGVEEAGSFTGIADERRHAHDE